MLFDVVIRNISKSCTVFLIYIAASGESSGGSGGSPGTPGTPLPTSTPPGFHLNTISVCLCILSLFAFIIHVM